MQIIHSIYLNSSIQITAIPETIQPVSSCACIRAIWRARAFCLCCSRATKLFLTRACRKAAGFLLKTAGVPPIWRALKPGGKCGKMKVSSACKTSWPLMGGDCQLHFARRFGAAGWIWLGESWFSTHHFPLFQDQKGIERLRFLLWQEVKSKHRQHVVWLPSLNCWSLVIYRSSTAAAAAAAAAGIFQFSIQSIQPIDARDSTSPAGLLAIRQSGNRFLPSLDDEFLVFVIRVSALVVVKKLCQFLAIDGMPLLDILLRSTQDSAY